MRVPNLFGSQLQKKYWDSGVNRTWSTEFTKISGETNSVFGGFVFYQKIQSVNFKSKSIDCRQSSEIRNGLRVSVFLEDTQKIRIRKYS